MASSSTGSVNSTSAEPVPDNNAINDDLCSDKVRVFQWDGGQGERRREAGMGRDSLGIPSCLDLEFRIVCRLTFTRSVEVGGFFHLLFSSVASTQYLWSQMETSVL